MVYLKYILFLVIVGLLFMPLSTCSHKVVSATNDDGRRITKHVPQDSPEEGRIIEIERKPFDFEKEEYTNGNFLLFAAIFTLFFNRLMRLGWILKPFLILFELLLIALVGFHILCIYLFGDPTVWGYLFTLVSIVYYTISTGWLPLLLTGVEVSEAETS